MEETHVQKLPPAIVIVPSPGISHVIPHVQFVKQLVLCHPNSFTITFLVLNNGGSCSKPLKELLGTLPDSASAIFLPPLNLPEDQNFEGEIAQTFILSRPAIRDSLKSISESTRLEALVIDMFGLDTFEVAKEFGVPSYIFFPSSAMTLSTIFHYPKLAESCSCEYRDLPEPVKAPGCVPVHGSDLVEPLQDRNSEFHKMVIQMAKKFSLASGIMVNSFMDLEPGPLTALREGRLGNYYTNPPPPVYPIGPLVRRGASISGSKCLMWLDKQPSGSVLYVSFGSVGKLSIEQLKELAKGLELSGQRFLWVVRSPHEKAPGFSFDSDKMSTTSDDFDFLPEGFVERTKEVGMVVPDWAPQVHVLSHGSTGGFLSHCGWSSLLETISNGVPLIAWPLFAEQRMNAVLVAEDLKVAFRVKKSGLVDHQEIAKYAKELIEGEKGELFRERMKQLKEKARMALGEQGSSTKSLAEVVKKWNECP